MVALPSGNYSTNEAEVTLGLLNAVHGDQSLTQRSAAKDLDIALGLVNTYLKRCVKAGLIKVKQAPSSRYAYYLTPKGFSEKSQLTATYLSQSMSFFRLVRVESADLRIALIGKSELCEITILGASDYGVELVAIIDAEAAQTTNTFMGIPVHAGVNDVEFVDAFLITDMKAPQDTYEMLVEIFESERVLAMPVLSIHQQVDAPSATKEQAS